MDQRTTNQLKAVGTMAVGAARVASSIATATGHGLIGGFLRSHHMMGHAARLGALGVKGGMEQIQKGLDDFNR